MKRVVRLVVAWLLVGAITAQAAYGATATVIPSNRMPVVGQTITAPVVVTVDNLGSYTMELRWNPAVLAYAGNSGPPAGFAGVVNDTKANSGYLRFNGANWLGASGNTTVLTVTFKAVGAGSSVLDLTVETMAEAGTFANLLPGLKVTDGQVWVMRPWIWWRW